MKCPECGGRGEVLDAPGYVLDGHTYWATCTMCDGQQRIKGFMVVENWMLACLFLSLPDALHWQALVHKKGFSIGALTNAEALGSYILSWYIDDASRRHL